MDVLSKFDWEVFIVRNLAREVSLSPRLRKVKWLGTDDEFISGKMIFEITANLQYISVYLPNGLF
jgi:hypothetical protein